MIRYAWQRFWHPSGLHPWRWRLLTVWVIGFSLIVGYAVRQGWRAHDDLCTTRENALNQVQGSEQYLAEVRQYRRDVETGHTPPRGRPPIAGITDKDITAQITRQKAYAAAIHC